MVNHQSEIVSKNASWGRTGRQMKPFGLTLGHLEEPVDFGLTVQRR